MPLCLLKNKCRSIENVLPNLTNAVVLTSTAHALATHGIPPSGFEGASDQQRFVPNRALQWISFAGVNVGFCERSRENKGSVKLKSRSAPQIYLSSVRVSWLMRVPSIGCKKAKFKHGRIRTPLCIGELAEASPDHA